MEAKEREEFTRFCERQIRSTGGEEPRVHWAKFSGLIQCRFSGDLHTVNFDFGDCGEEEAKHRLTLCCMAMLARLQTLKFGARWHERKSDA
jgi:hypothetical protein